MSKYISMPYASDPEMHEASKDMWFREIIKKCHEMLADDILDVISFGKNHDLKLMITKDSEYKGGEKSDIVTIVTSQQKDKRLYPVDDTEDTYVTDGSLYKELERIWNYQNFHLL